MAGSHRGTCLASDIVFDLRAESRPFLGLGVQTWPGDARLDGVLEQLGVRWVRVSYATVSDVPPTGTREEYDAYWAKSNPRAIRGARFPCDARCG